MTGFLILAPPKCGTTILYHILKKSLPHDSVCLFEPTECAPPASATVTGKQVLSKVLLNSSLGESHYGGDACSFFDHKIFIRRDPRDLLISFCLYTAFHTALTSRFDAFVQMMSALKEKEHRPASVSFLELLHLKERLEYSSVGSISTTLDLIVQLLDFARRVVANHGDDLFVLNYEDIVDRQLGPLESFLSLKLTTETEVGPELRRVVRTKGYGDWRNWFTPADVEVLRPRLSEFMSPTEEADWKLSENPQIAEDVSSGYLERLARERRNFADIEYSLEAIPATRHFLDDWTQRRCPIQLPGIRSLRTEAYPNQGAEIRNPRIQTRDGRRVNVLIRGESYTGAYEISFTQSFPNMSCWMTVMDRHGEIMLRMGTALHGIELDTAARSGKESLAFDIGCHFVPDVYFVNVGVTTRDESGNITFLYRLVHAMLIIVTDMEQLSPRLLVGC